jgi:hypothetical protein
LSLSQRTFAFLLPIVFASTAASGASRAPGVSPVEAPAPLLPRVESATQAGYRVVVPIPAPEIQTGDVFGEQLAEIRLPGGTLDAPAGAPQLPSITLLLHVPWGVDPHVRATAGAERSLGTLRPEPLPYLVSDRARWSAIGAAALADFLNGGAYARGAAGAGAPEPQLASVVNTAAGEERVLLVKLRPVRWDPRTGRTTVVDEITLDVTWVGVPRSPPSCAARADAPPPTRARFGSSPGPPGCASEFSARASTS